MSAAGREKKQGILCTLLILFFMIFSLGRAAAWAEEALLPQVPFTLEVIGKTNPVQRRVYLYHTHTYEAYEMDENVTK